MALDGDGANTKSGILTPQYGRFRSIFRCTVCHFERQGQTAAPQAKVMIDAGAGDVVRSERFRVRSDDELAL